MDQDELYERARKIMMAKAIKQFNYGLNEATDDLEDFYLKVVDKFYSEYTPINEREQTDPDNPRYSSWNRHPFSSIEESGMARTYERVKGTYWKNDETLIMYSGLALNTMRMYRDYNACLYYNGHNDWVLWSFVKGYHGLPEPYDYAPRSRQKPIKACRNYINNYLMKKLNKDIKV